MNNINTVTISGTITATGEMSGTVQITGDPVLDSVTVKSTGVSQTIVPERGVDGYNEITVSPLDMETVTVKSNSSTIQTVVPSQGKDGISSVSVEPILLQSKTVTPGACAITVVPDSDFDGLSSVTVGASAGGTDTLDEMFNESSSSPKTITMTDNNAAHTCYGVACGLNIILPNTITKIGALAFNGKDFIKSVSGPGVTEIGSGAFNGCNSLDSINFPLVETIYGNAFANIDNGSVKTYRFPSLSHIVGAAFAGSYRITDIYIGYDGVCVLDDAGAFNNWGVGKTNIHVPSNRLSEYEADTKWAQAVSSNYIALVGDYDAQQA